MGVCTCLAAAWTRHMGSWVWVGRGRCGVRFRGYRVRGAAWGPVSAASPASGFRWGAAFLPRPLPSPGSRVPAAPGGLLSPAANWRVGGAAAPGMLGTRGADSGAPATLGHRALQHRLQRGSECDACACYPCNREPRWLSGHRKVPGHSGLHDTLFKISAGGSADRTKVARNARSWASSPAFFICHLSTFEMDPR